MTIVVVGGVLIDLYRRRPDRSLLHFQILARACTSTASRNSCSTHVTHIFRHVVSQFRVYRMRRCEQSSHRGASKIRFFPTQTTLLRCKSHFYFYTPFFWGLSWLLRNAVPTAVGRLALQLIPGSQKRSWRGGGWN